MTHFSLFFLLSCWRIDSSVVTLLQPHLCKSAGREGWIALPESCHWRAGWGQPAHIKHSPNPTSLDAQIKSRRLKLFQIWRYAALYSFHFSSIWFKLLFRRDRKLTFETIETQVNPVGFQNKTAFCERDASDSLPVDQNHSTIKMKTDPVYFGC